MKEKVSRGWHVCSWILRQLEASLTVYGFHKSCLLQQLEDVQRFLTGRPEGVNWKHPGCWCGNKAERSGSAPV